MRARSGQSVPARRIAVQRLLAAADRVADRVAAQAVAGHLAVHAAAGADDEGVVADRRRRVGAVVVGLALVTTAPGVGGVAVGRLGGAVLVGLAPDAPGVLGAAAVTTMVVGHARDAGAARAIVLQRQGAGLGAGRCLARLVVAPRADGVEHADRIALVLLDAIFGATGGAAPGGVERRRVDAAVERAAGVVARLVVVAGHCRALQPL